MFEKLQMLALADRFLKSFEKFAAAHEAHAIEKKRENNLLEASITARADETPATGKPN